MKMTLRFDNMLALVEFTNALKMQVDRYKDEEREDDIGCIELKGVYEQVKTACGDTLDFSD